MGMPGKMKKWQAQNNCLWGAEKRYSIVPTPFSSFYFACIHFALSFSLSDYLRAWNWLITADSG